VAERRSVALVSAVAPYPKDSGKRVVLAGLLEYWVERLGPDSVHYVLVADPRTPTPDLPVRVHRIGRPTAQEQLRSLAWRTVATGRHAIQESMLYSPRVRAELSATLAAVDADLEVYDTVRMSQYTRDIEPRPGQRRVVYLDDLFSVRYGRMRELLRRRADVDLDPLGEFRAHVPAPLARLVGNRAVQRLVLATEQRLVARREVEAAREFAAALLVSPVETRVLAERVPGANAQTLPPVVEGSAARRVYDGRPDFVLLGLLSLPHNHDAAMTFLTRTMPEVVRRMPDARVHIVGRGATPQLLAAAARFPRHVVVEGFVPDLDRLLSSACALLAPLRVGSGIKIKVIEALSRGLPVLGTPCGTEGIAGGAHHGVIVEPDLDRHAEIMAALTNPVCNARLSSAARRHFAGTYAREAAFRRYDEVFGRAGTTPERPLPAPPLAVGART